MQLALECQNERSFFQLFADLSKIYQTIFSNVTLLDVSNVSINGPLTVKKVRNPCRKVTKRQSPK